MNANGVASMAPVKAANSSLEKFQLALQSVEPSKRQRREEALAEAFDTIKQHVERKVPWKTIVAKFNEAYALGMHPARLRKEFDEERKRREDVYGIAGFDHGSHGEGGATKQVDEEISA
ncbi:hypothetical protein ABQJ54_10905 [Rhodanobacter sp. Si-c]|uniref:Uncharacterized protein n=1 Tax=Rhodanobacter lycopersici TaxID=3162487 RepID=A0ABV3QES9_9GAMM